MNSVWRTFFNALCWFVFNWNGKTLSDFRKICSKKIISSASKCFCFCTIPLRPWHIRNVKIHLTESTLYDLMLSVLFWPFIWFNLMLPVVDTQPSHSIDAKFWIWTFRFILRRVTNKKWVWDTNAEWLRFARNRWRSAFFHQRFV